MRFGNLLDDAPPAICASYGRVKWHCYESGGRPCIKEWCGRSLRPKSWYFRSEGERQEHVDRLIASEKAREEFRAKMKAEEAAHLAKMMETIQVGTLLHYSWGYDQTQCDYFQVVEKRGRVVILREIGCEVVPGSEGFMSDRRRPVADKFYGEPIRKMIGAYGIRMDHGSASPCKADEANYCSWYH